MRRWGTALAAVTLAAAGLAVTAVPATAATAAQNTAPRAAAACATAWGSGDKTAATTAYTPLADIRTGRHDCYDRMVIDLRGTSGAKAGYQVRYVDQLHQDGSGDVIPVGGGAKLEIRVAAPSYDPETGAATYPGRAGQPLPGVDISGYRTFKDTRFVGSFEGDTQIGLGVRARLPFRVLQLPDRLVIDVAHSWSTAR
ncbi:AMIN-like domain-containing (lipo)protein [Streptomyces sp. 8N706]|uniref:AMIN-like domain-containing (lipo)protein n=1 Tax=Streptomyces sp. 8N706 TaxID=3457416 RepID=UPI003FD15568